MLRIVFATNGGPDKSAGLAERLQATKIKPDVIFSSSDLDDLATARMLRDLLAPELELSESEHLARGTAVAGFALETLPALDADFETVVCVTDTGVASTNNFILHGQPWPEMLSLGQAQAQVLEFTGQEEWSGAQGNVGLEYIV